MTRMKGNNYFYDFTQPLLKLCPSKVKAMLEQGCSCARANKKQQKKDACNQCRRHPLPYSLLQITYFSSRRLNAWLHNM